MDRSFYVTCMYTSIHTLFRLCIFIYILMTMDCLFYVTCMYCILVYVPRWTWVSSEEDLYELGECPSQSSWQWSTWPCKEPVHWLSKWPPSVSAHWEPFRGQLGRLWRLLTDGCLLVLCDFGRIRGLLRWWCGVSHLFLVCYTPCHHLCCSILLMCSVCGCVRACMRRCVCVCACGCA